MKISLRHVAALALVCTLSVPAMSPGGPGHFEFGIPTRTACEARLRSLGPLLGYSGEHPHCDCSDDSPSPKATPKSQHD